MHAESAVQAGACEADEGAEFGGGPLRGGGGAVDALAVAGAFLEGGELMGEKWVLGGLLVRWGGKGKRYLGFCFRVDFPHCGRWCMVKGVMALAMST